MTNRARAAALAGAVALVLAACGEAPAEESESGGSAAEEGGSDYVGCMVSDFGGFDDQSFNQSGLQGLEAAADDLGFEPVTAESAAESDYAPNIDSMVSSGCDQIVAVGFALAEATAAAAEANPDTNFALVDAALEEPLDNVKPLQFDTAQAAFLAGYAAAATTATGTVATYGGQPFPSVTIFMDGFVDGVAYHNEQKGTQVQVLGWDKAAQNGSFTGDFTDPAKGRNTTQNFIDAGADVILPVAGPVGAGTLAAARERPGTKVIWVDADGYNTQPDFRDLILTSVVKEIGAAVQESITADEGGEFTADPYVGTLENGGVSLAPFHDFESQVPAELAGELDTIEQQIVSGEITVESLSTPGS